MVKLIYLRAGSVAVSNGLQVLGGILDSCTDFNTKQQYLIGILGYLVFMKGTTGIQSKTFWERKVPMENGKAFRCY